MRAGQIDLLRGLIMVFMAIDHASAMIARVHFTEIWGIDFNTYPDLTWWFTRFISHLCAPGFFFLMGMSVYLFAQKRMESQWTTSKIRNYFFKRGGLILLFMFFLEFPAWILGTAFSTVEQSGPGMPGSYTGGFLIPSTVLYGLGMCMILAAFLWRLKHWQLLALTLIFFAGSFFYIEYSNPSEAFHPLEHFIIVPGMSDGAFVIYPVIPWLGITTFGIFWAQLLGKKNNSFWKISLITGLSFIGLFLLLRYLEFGNFQKDSYEGWISFFTLIKYPPSITFALITCGINLIFLALFTLIQNANWLEPIRVFGQTAMFFYILHLYLYAIMGLGFRGGTSAGMMYLMWFLGLVILYFICNRFLQFKKQTALDSFWRMI